MRFFILYMALASSSALWAQTNSVLPASPATPAPGATPATLTAAAPEASSAAPSVTVPAATSPATAGDSTNAPAGASPSTMTPAEAKILRECAQLVGDGKYDAALTKLNADIQANPRSVNAFVLRGQVYSDKKLTDLEANDFEAAHLLEPNNPIVNFDVAEVKFIQKSYDAARIGFADLAKTKGSMIGDLAAYKMFLCDLVGGHMDEAAKEFDVYNKVGSGPAYYYANAAWDLVHKQTEDARSWLGSAEQIYSPQKNNLYAQSLIDLGLLPLPAPAGQ